MPENQIMGWYYDPMENFKLQRVTYDVGSQQVTPSSLVATNNNTYFLTNVHVIGSGSSSNSNTVGWYFNPNVNPQFVELIDPVSGRATPYHPVVGSNNTIFVANNDGIGASYTTNIVGWYYLTSFPPTNLTGNRLTNNFPFQTQLLNQLNWGPSPEAYLVSYNIYRNGAFYASVPAVGGLPFNDQLIDKKLGYTYEVSSVNSFGFESERVSVIAN